jgi:hypothetical protein
MKDIAIFLYSKSKLIAQPWADAGVECHLFDLASTSRREGNLVFHGGDVRKKRALLGRLCRENRCLFLGSFTPCTDMAISGAKHFESKALEDSLFWAKAMELAMIGVDLAEFFGMPYFLENPMSMISTLWREPDFKFDPWMFGGYLPEGHQHALFPEIYPGRDAYNKETWIWCGGGFVVPKKLPVTPVGNDYPGFAKLGGKSERTKEIRSVTPEGFSRAVFEANCKTLHSEKL